jgi:hypothetical protein
MRDNNLEKIKNNREKEKNEQMQNNGEKPWLKV